MSVEVYLVFNGNCREAAEFYAEVFKTEKPVIQTFGEAHNDPNFEMPEEAKNLVMHTRLNIAGSRIMFSDNWPGQPYIVGNNVTVALITDDVEYLKNSFNGLKEGGQVTMELQETPWTKAYGSLKDKFGIEWQLNHEVAEVK